jgi:hypothetical protein
LAQEWPAAYRPAALFLKSSPMDKVELRVRGTSRHSSSASRGPAIPTASSIPYGPPLTTKYITQIKGRSVRRGLLDIGANGEIGIDSTGA